MTMKPLLTTIERVGQPYVDEPVMREVSKASPLALSIAGLFEREISPRIEELDHYNHVRLRWIRPNTRTEQ